MIPATMMVIPAMRITSATVTIGDPEPPSGRALDPRVTPDLPAE